LGPLEPPRSMTQLEQRLHRLAPSDMAHLEGLRLD
jgi:hypothetical protein